MIKAGIDQDAITKMFSEATAKQGEALRKGVSDATLKALQGRELTMENIRKVLKTVTTAATAGVGKHAAGSVDIEAMLGKAVAGMDDALLKAVEANRKALQQFVDQGASLQEKQLKGAITNLEKMEDTFFVAVGKAVEGTASVPLQGPWKQVLDTFQSQGSGSGARATATAQDLLEQAKATLRNGRATTAKATQAMLDGYAALVSGVLIGMSEGLQGGSAAAGPRAKTSKK
jgi:flagellar hook-basal body complex protein FliE